MKKLLIFATSALALCLGGTQAVAAKADKIKIGFVTTFTGPAGAIGADMRRSVEVALDHLGNRMGGIPVEVIFEDDQQKPEIGKQRMEKLLTKDRVDIVSGIIWSNVLIATYRDVIRAKKLLVVSNAGWNGIAGKACHRQIFSTSWQNDQVPMALGEVLNKRGVKSLYEVAPNYAAGKDMINGLERTFKGKIVGRDMTTWPSQRDFSTEIAKIRAANPEGVFIFYPGGHTDAFVRQYTQAGLSGKIPLYSVFSVDPISLPRLQKANITGVLGTFNTQFWSPDLDVEQNRKYVADYRKLSGGQYPAHYGAQSYDSIMLIASAVEAVKGDVSKLDDMIEAMRKADFPSIRGKFAFNNNHVPIQNFYLREVVKDADGNWTVKVVDTVYRDHKDPYHTECKMKKTW
jgi:branched-chain amino acid transport system substrate-binding protein